MKFPSLGIRLRHALLSISTDEILAARRGFCCDGEEIRQRLESVGGAFLDGYHLTLEDSDAQSLCKRLALQPASMRGFAFEGAAMGLALLDALLPTQQRFNTLLDSDGKHHAYMMFVGAGWAYARLPWLRGQIWRRLSRKDVLLKWLALDGFGFHDGYFHWRERSVLKRPSTLEGYAGHAYDQGLGRSLWFVTGANPERIAKALKRFSGDRHSDLWSGVGLAAGYAGGASKFELQQLGELASEFKSSFGQGLIFAAAARNKAGNMAEHTDTACQVILGINAMKAFEIATVASRGLYADEGRTAYELWRYRIRQILEDSIFVPMQEGLNAL